MKDKEQINNDTVMRQSGHNEKKIEEKFTTAHIFWSSKVQTLLKVQLATVNKRDSDLVDPFEEEG
jgi:hypothetical protein